MLRKVLQMVVLVWVQLYLFAPELMKLPMLALHFNEHRSVEQDLSFDDFLELHYAQSGHEEADHEGHESLPFHHHHGAALDACVCKVWTSDPAPAVSFPSLMGGLPMGGVLDDAELAGHRRALLQPPRCRA